MNKIDSFIEKQELRNAVNECLSLNMPGLAQVINQFFIQDDNLTQKIVETKNFIKVFVCGDWNSSEGLCKHYNKQSMGNYTWDNIQITWEQPADYNVVFNKPPDGVELDLSKTILFRMEPYMERNEKYWKWWSNPPKEKFLFAGFHDSHLNNIEFHVSKNYYELITQPIEKTQSCMSTVVSQKYYDPGHKKRIDFLKFLETKNLNVHIYGSNVFHWNSYKGSPPSHCKDEALLPYKYTFNVENNSIDNYVTEKLVDGIVCECLTFYSGCKNVGKYIDDRAFVYLDLEDFEKDYQTIITMIENDEWSKRIQFIREAKLKILNELQFFPRIAKIINDYRSNSSC